MADASDMRGTAAPNPETVDPAAAMGVVGVDATLRVGAAALR
jgi:hypothetical protein